ncbi:MAG TPA: GGDEF domain-containing protein, partial [Candidatus Brocadiales bacterium]|nr:GGDEF domain-containing protein [Candidatus Brocadiales bacterium]
QARTENSPLALLIINLDCFEEINNTLGHDNGDLILQQMAIRLQGITGEPNRVARLGGDVFAVLLKSTDAEGASKRAEEIIGAIKESIAIADLFIEVSASIGISLFPGHGADADTLIRRAEIAMYVAKRIESILCIYSPKYDQYSQKKTCPYGRTSPGHRARPDVPPVSAEDRPKNRQNKRCKGLMPMAASQIGCHTPK